MYPSTSTPAPINEMSVRLVGDCTIAVRKEAARKGITLAAVVTEVLVKHFGIKPPEAPGRVIDLKEAAALFGRLCAAHRPELGIKPPGHSALVRWITEGSCGLKLGGVCEEGRYRTTDIAIAVFFNKAPPALFKRLASQQVTERRKDSDSEDTELAAAETLLAGLNGQHKPAAKDNLFDANVVKLAAAAAAPAVKRPVRTSVEDARAFCALVLESGPKTTQELRVLAEEHGISWKRVSYFNGDALGVIKEVDPLDRRGAIKSTWRLRNGEAAGV